jgi:hypothetical protein
MDDGGEQVVAIRFPDVDVPAGATVTSAIISFDVDEVRPGQSDADVTVSIFGEASGDPAAISDTAFDLSSRTPTTAAVVWNPEAAGAEHDMMYTVDVSSVVQEIISLDGWAPGNALMIMFGKVSGAGVRWVEGMRENSGVGTPGIEITYSTGDGCSSAPVQGAADTVGTEDTAEEDLATGVMYGTSSDLELMNDGGIQLVGVRFPSVDIPPSSIVSSAIIGFDVDEVRPGQSDLPVTVAIFGEKNANAAAITDTGADLSSRTATGSSVQWSPEASVAEHDMLYTADLSIVVTEIVAQSGWASGNPMMILFAYIDGEGTRWVEGIRENNGVMTPGMVYSYSGGPANQVSGIDSIVATTDDAEEDLATGVMYGTSSDLEIMHDGGEQVVAVRFPSVNIPANAVVISATITFDVDEVRPGQSDADVTVNIYGESNPNSAELSSDDANLSTRTPTSAAVTWQPAASVAEHELLVSADISDIINEIVAMTGWAQGNPVTILFGHASGSGES